MAISPPASRHKNTNALITGGGQGLGLAIAKQLADEGCRNLALVGRDAKKLDTAAADLRALGAKVVTISADVSKAPECARAVAEAINGLGTVNALVNAAASTARGSVTDASEADFDAMFDTNVKGVFFLMQGVVRHALERKAPASILNILSMSAHTGQSNLTIYSASKGAVATLTKNTAIAHRNDRIRCNAILPGWMDTPGEDIVQRKFEGASDGWLERAEAKQPFGQLIKTDQLALLASYMLSNDAGVMTGSLVDYDQTVQTNA
ncbi:MAG: SDR family oxidoreductase [Devosia sp.]